MFGALMDDVPSARPKVLPYAQAAMSMPAPPPHVQLARLAGSRQLLESVTSEFVLEASMLVIAAEYYARGGIALLVERATRAAGWSPNVGVMSARRLAQKSPRTLPKTEGFILPFTGLPGALRSQRSLAGVGGPECFMYFAKRSADFDCVGRLVAKCRAAPALSSEANLRSQDRPPRRYRRAAYRGSLPANA